MRYLSTTIEYCLKYKGDLNYRRSHMVLIFYLANSPINWESKIQPTIALSNTEAEYMPLTAASKEAVYLLSILQETNFVNFLKEPALIYCDNIGAQKMVKNSCIPLSNKTHRNQDALRQSSI